MIAFRPSTPADIRQFHGELPYSARAVTAEKDGRPVGVGGVYYAAGHAIAFSAIDRAAMSKREIVKAGRRVVEVIERVRAPVLAIPENMDTAPTTLAHYGFRPLDGNYWVRGA